MEFHEITNADRVAVDRLYRQLYPETTSPPDLASSNFSAEYLPRLVKHNNEIIGMALGVIVCYGDSPQAYIEDVVVDQAHRGHGVGRALIQHLLSEFSQRQVEVVFVATSFDTEEDNPIPFYQKLGFRTMRSPWLVTTPNRD